MRSRTSPPSLAARLEPWGSLLLVTGGLAIWEILHRTGVLTSMFFPPPSSVAVDLVILILSGDVAYHAGITLARVAIGFSIGAGAGLLLGLAMGMWRRLHTLLDPLVALAHPVPKIAVLPLILVVFGIGEGSKIALGALGAFFPMLINTVVGVRQISSTYFEVARSYGAAQGRMFRRVVLPGSLPMVLTGARISINVALVLTIAGELLVSQSGLGQKMWFGWQTMRIPDVYAWLAVTSLLGITLNSLLKRFSAWAMPWESDVGSGSG